MTADDIDDSSAPLIEHLAELRNRLIKCVLAFVVAMVVCFTIWNPIFNFLTRPICHALEVRGQNCTLVLIKLQEGFFVAIRISVFGGFVLSFPVIATQLWRFVAPGLYRSEKGAFLPFLVASPAMFALGGAFAFYVILPMAFGFFLDFQQMTPAAVAAGEAVKPDHAGVLFQGSMEEYLALTTKFIIAFGLSFQLPVLLTLLGKAGLVSARGLGAVRKYAVVAILVLAAGGDAARRALPGDPVLGHLRALRDLDPAGPAGREVARGGPARAGPVVRGRRGRGCGGRRRCRCRSQALTACGKKSAAPADTLARIAAALERMSPPPAAAPDFDAAQAFVWHVAPDRLDPVEDVARVDIALLVGVDRVRDILLANTRAFARGLPANNALLWGARGMGKSSLVKAVHAAVRAEGLAPILVELSREDLPSVAALLRVLRGARDRRFVLFCDDLSFAHDDTHYKSLKAVLDGGIEGRPPNVLFYATSNRRHLMPREMIENERSSAISPSEAVEEKVSLSDRFGLWLGFHPCSQDDYLAMVQGYCDAYGVAIDDDALRAEAVEWQATRGARSGRVAWQFFTDLAARRGVRIDA